MKNIIIGILIVCCAMVTMPACKKKEHKPTHNVYIQGVVAGQNHQIYWVNGHASVINGAYTGKMTVAKGDVYIPTEGGYYKNNVFVAIPDAYYIKSIALDGENVYATGQSTQMYNKPYYWKNGNIVLLEEEDSASRIEQIAISAGNIYLGGYKSNALGYWRNGVYTHCTHGYACLEGMTAIAGDVFMWGSFGYYKNQSLYQLSSNIGYITDLVVEGTDVYAVALNDKDPMYWKNAQPVNIDSHQGAITLSIAVKNGSVYVAGSKYAAPNQGQDSAIIWENEKMSILSPNARAFKKVIVE